jgi:hypothetical protein
MKNLRKTLIVIPVVLFILACQVINRPIQQVEDTAGTAAAIATQGGQIITQVSGLTTNIAPIETMIPSVLPEINEDFLNPQSTPLSEWKEIPIMPQAIVGDESDGYYVYRIASTSDEIQEFYKTKLAELGWESSFSLPMAGTAILVYSRDEQVVTITIMPTDTSDMLVMITME